ncbi:MAG: L-serine ammonia-lyase, iron-sulfur-dependent, subunit alpha, partial [Oscillospiraceae bacterium]
AKAKEILGGDIETIVMKVSGNILKNAMGVGIPNTDMYGLQVAVALSAIAGRASYGLEVLSGTNEEDACRAKKMVEDHRVTVLLADTAERLYIEAVVSNATDTATVIISGGHTDFLSASKNGVPVHIETPGVSSSGEAGETSLTLHGIWNFSMSVPLAELAFLQDTIDLNCAIAKVGLTNEYGLRVGRSMLCETEYSMEDTDLATYISAVTAAAADARMSGCSLPVMSTTGSGNQGITASLPVIAAAKKLHSSREELLRALTLSELVTIHIKHHIGKLSALCGCAIAASAGVSCALTYLKGGDRTKMYCAVQNMIADISGLICDGAKETCSLKIATAVSGAVQCATLAIHGIAATQKDGIVEADVENSILNLARLGNQGMVETDKVILDMMITSPQFI